MQSSFRRSSGYFTTVLTSRRKGYHSVRPWCRRQQIHVVVILLCVTVAALFGGLPGSSARRGRPSKLPPERRILYVAMCTMCTMIFGQRPQYLGIVGEKYRRSDAFPPTG